MYLMLCGHLPCELQAPESRAVLSIFAPRARPTAVLPVGPAGRQGRAVSGGQGAAQSSVRGDESAHWRG